MIKTCQSVLDSIRNVTDKKDEESKQSGKVRQPRESDGGDGGRRPAWGYWQSLGSLAGVVYCNGPGHVRGGLGLPRTPAFWLLGHQPADQCTRDLVQTGRPWTLPFWQMEFSPW